MKNQSDEIIDTIIDEKTPLINESEQIIMDTKDEKTPLINRSEQIVIDIITDEETQDNKYEASVNWKNKSLLEKIIFVIIAIPVYFFIDILPYVLKLIFINFPIMIFSVICVIFNYVFIKSPLWFYNNIIVQLYYKLCSICRTIFIDFPNWIYNNIVVLFYYKLCSVCRRIFMDFPNWFYNNVIIKIINYIHKGILQAITYIIKPVCRFIYEYFLYPVYKFIKNTIIISWSAIKYIISHIKVILVYVKTGLSQTLNSIRINIIAIIRNMKNGLSQTIHSIRIFINTIMTNIKIILSQIINTLRLNINLAITTSRTYIKESLRSIRGR